MANQAPGSTAAGGGRGVFRSQLQIQESREGHQDEVKWPTLESEDSESQSSASSIFQQGRVPIGWLVSDSGSSAHDRSERASGGKDSQNTSSSSSAEQQAARLAGGRVQDVPDTLSGRGKGQPVQAGKTGYSSSSWFATTFEETEIEDLAATQEKKSSARGSSSSFGALTGAAVEFVSEQSGNSQPKEDEEIPEDVEQRCMDILMNLPLDDEGRLTSLGSQSHKSGTCKPCAYWFKRACKHGVACYNCHIAHEGQKPKRLRSTKAKIHKDIGDSSIPEEVELSQKDYKKSTADRAIPSAPGPVGGENVDLKVTAAVLKRVSMARGFKVTEPPSANYSVDSARSRTKTSL